MLPGVGLRFHRLKGSAPQDPTYMPTTSTGPLLLLPNWLQVANSHSLLLRLENLLGRLTKLRKTFYLYSLLCYQESNSGRAKWKRCIGQSLKVQSFHALSAGAASQQVRVFTKLEALHIFRARAGPGQVVSSPASPFPQVQGWGSNFLPSVHSSLW